VNHDFLINGLAYPPSENAIYSDVPFKDRVGKLRVRRILNSVGKEYKRDVSNYMNSTGLTTQLREFIEYHQAVDLYIFLFRPDWYTKAGLPNCQPGDASNRIKILQDVLFESVGINDCHVFCTCPRKVYGEKPAVGVVFRKTPDEVDFFS